MWKVELVQLVFGWLLARTGGLSVNLIQVKEPPMFIFYLAFAPAVV